MERNVSNMFDQYTKQSRRRKRRKRFVTILGTIVLLITTVIMILPAISASNDTYCGYEEHTHTDQCHTAEQSCTMTEHLHTSECMSDKTADIETAEEWEKLLETVPIVGNQQADILAIAQSQLGYSESERNYTIGEDGQTKNGYNRYGVWLDDPYAEWNVAFISFCAHYAGIETIPKTNLYDTIWDVVATSIVPEVGMLTFIDTDLDGKGETLGIVSLVQQTDDGECENIVIIQGDCKGKVATVTYPIEDKALLGYATYPETVSTTVEQQTILFSNNTNQQTENAQVTSDEEAEAPQVKTLEVRFAKCIAKNDFTIEFPKIEGAQLALYKVKEDEETLIPDTEVKGQLIDRWISEDANGDTRGYHTLQLTDGTYYLIEEETPENYAGLLGAIQFTVDTELQRIKILEYPGYERLILQTTQQGVLSGLDFLVYNTAIYKLPGTGGIGTTWYITGGLILIMVSMAILLYRRDKYG